LQMVEAHQQFVDTALAYLSKARASLVYLKKMGLLGTVQNLCEIEIQQYMIDADRQIDQIQRRVMKGEKIPHAEKVFSIFEPHTEWIVKGKAGISQELGLRVCIMEDHHRFLLHHRVMEKQTDDQVAVLMVSETKERFADFSSCSFDKGFHSPSNQTKLLEILDVVALPRKGKRTKKIQELESSEDYQRAHNKHSAVESAINALEVHGLDRCPDHGLAGFKRYVALSIVARNIQRIGAILTEKERERLERQRRRRLKQAA
jgi:IS5 family transposase